jgi:Cof subfamily protein (haloacid dehalogenase superfamily)
MRVILEKTTTGTVGANEPRLLACDLDGTLLDPTGVIRPAVQEAIGAVRAAGVHVVLATGRSPWDTAPSARTLGLGGPQIVMNGGAFMWPGGEDVVWASRLDPEVVLETIDFARGAGLKPLLGFTDGHACESPLGLVPEVPDFAIGPRLRVLQRIEDMAGRRPVRVYMATRPDEHSQVLAETRQLFGDRASVVFGDRNGVEVMSAGTHKGSALRYLAESLGIDRSRVAAMGDGPNDREMLEWAGFSASVLPRDAALMGAESTPAGAAIVPSSDEDGAVHALARFFPSLGLEPGAWNPAEWPGTWRGELAVSETAA